MSNITVNTEILRSTEIDEYRLLELSQIFDVSDLTYGTIKSLDSAGVSVHTLFDSSEHNATIDFCMVFVLSGTVNVYVEQYGGTWVDLPYTAPGTFCMAGIPLDYVEVYVSDTVGTYISFTGGKTVFPPK